MSHLQFWNKLQQELILETDYYVLAGNNQVINTSNIDNKLANTGDIFIIIPYFFYPDKKLTTVCFISTGTPQITSAHFILDVFKTTPLEKNDKIVHYGSTITIEVNTLLLPDYRKHGVKYTFEIDLYDQRYSPPPVIYTYKNLVLEAKSINYLYKRSKKFMLPIPIELRKYHHENKQMRHITFGIRGKEVSTNTTLENVQDILGKTEAGYHSNGKEIKWKELKGDILGFSTSSEIFIPFDTYSKILEEKEKAKNNTIQYIGDIEYSHKNNESCSFSQITIQSGDTTATIFDENEKVKDITNEFTYELIVGANPTEVLISVNKLRTPPLANCKGTLLPDGEKHDKWENVFQMQSVLPSYRNILGKREADNFGQQFSLKPSDNVAAIQGLEYKKHYFKETESSIRLHLGYIYDKAIRDGKWGGNLVVTDLSLWMFNYLWLNSKHAQTYFVPISTCRYTNQIAIIRLFPNIEWEIAFLVTLLPGFTRKLRYKRQKVNAIHRDYDFTYIQKDLSIETKAEGELGWSIQAKCIIDGIENSVNFKKIEQNIDAVINTYNSSKKILDQLNPNGINFSNSPAVQKRVIEIDFAIDPPNIGFALSQKFDKARNGRLVPCYKGAFRADPLIGITVSVDLVPLIGKIPYIGTIIDWILKILSHLTKSDIYITVSIGMAVSCDLSLIFNEIDGYSNEQEWRADVPLTLAAGAKSNDVVLIPTVTTGSTIVNIDQEKWKVEGAVSTSLTFTKVYGYDQTIKRQYESSKGVWNPAKLTITCYELISSKTTVKANQKEEFTIFEEQELFINENEYI